MKDSLLRFITFLRGVFSEENGTPSASRIIMLGLAIVSSFCLVLLCREAIHTTAERAGMILSALPAIIASMAAFITAPYGSNKLSAAIQSFSKKDPNE
jgi:hypothetical protein